MDRAWARPRLDLSTASHSTGRVGSWRGGGRGGGRGRKGEGDGAGEGQQRRGRRAAELEAGAADRGAARRVGGAPACGRAAACAAGRAGERPRRRSKREAVLEARQGVEPRADERGGEHEAEGEGISGCLARGRVLSYSEGQAARDGIQEREVQSRSDGRLVEGLCSRFNNQRRARVWCQS